MYSGNSSSMQPNAARSSVFMALLFTGGLWGCQSNQSLSETTQTSVPVTGGEATSADGRLNLDFPSGALDGDTEITISTNRARTAPNLISFVWELGPHGTQFKKPVEIRIRVGSNLYGARLANLDGPEPVFLEDSRYDASTGEVVATLAHFSSYGVVRAYVPCAQQACGTSCTLCDPSDQGCVEPPGARRCAVNGSCSLAAPMCGGSDAGVVADTGPADMGTIVDVRSVPPSADFGTVDLACTSVTSTQSFILRNDGNTDVQITSASISPANVGFSIVGTAPSGNFAAGTQITVNVAFNPTTAGLWLADLVVNTNAATMPQLLVPLTGTATNTNSRTETFTQSSKADVLIVMDPSCSTGDEQATFAANAGTILATLDAATVDYHVGVTTTDVTMNGEQGRLVGSPGYVTPSTAGRLQALRDRILVGTAGSPTEAGIEAARLATLAGTNPGFWRNDAWTTFIFVSDEPDQSPLPIADYIAHFSNFKGNGVTEQVQVNTIVGDIPNGCNGAGGTAAAGTGYEDLRAALGGVHDSICSGSWSSTLSNLGGSGFGLSRVFKLAEVAASVTEVRVNGSIAPASQWSYDATIPAIVFGTMHRPATGDQIQVTYQSQCTP